MTAESLTLDIRLQAARSTLLDLQAAHGDASLALARGHCSEAEVDALEEEIQAAEKAVHRLEAALAAQADANTDAAREARHQARQDARKQVDALGERMEALALAMVAQLEGLGPLVAEFDALSTKRRAAAADAIRFPNSDATGKVERALARVVELAALREGAVPSAALAALWRSGLTRVLSTEPIGAVLLPPDFYTPYGRGDVREALKQSLSDLRARLGANLDELQKQGAKAESARLP